MARKRPPLIPIFDSRVREFYNWHSWTWLPLGRALQDEERRSRINELRPSWLGQEVSLLRILDLAIWMSFRDGPPEPASEDVDALI